MKENKEFIQDEIFAERLLISVRADQTELDDNIRVARVLLSSFDDMFIFINEHLFTIGHRIPNTPSTENWETVRALRAKTASSQHSVRLSNKAARW